MKRQPKAQKEKVVDYTVDLMPPILSQQEFQKLETEPCKCYACSSIFPVKNKFFSRTNSKLYSGNNYYLPVCDGCLDKLYVSYVNKLSDKEKAIERICMHFDIYYSKEISDLVDSVTPKSYIKMYIDKANLTSKAWTGKTYAHTLSEQENEFNQFTEACAIKDIITGGVVDDEEQAERVKQYIKFWGIGYTLEEYQMLQANFEEWNEKYEPDQHAQIVLYKTISLLQMKITTGAQKGEKIDPLIKQLNECMSAADIQPKQKNANTLSDKQTLGTLLKKFEEERPLPDPEPEWEKASIVKYISAWFLGHFSRMMGLKNSWRDLYEEEIEKYTAHPPELREEDEESDEPTFEELFGSHIEE